MDRYTITVEEAARRLGIGRSLAYSLIREGALPHLRLGSRIVIPVSALQRLLDQAQGSDGGDRAPVPGIAR